MNSSRFLLSLWLALVDMTPPLCVVCAGQQVRSCLVALDPERVLQNAVGRQLAEFKSCAGCHLGRWPACAEISSHAYFKLPCLASLSLRVVISISSGCVHKLQCRTTKQQNVICGRCVAHLAHLCRPPGMPRRSS